MGFPLYTQLRTISSRELPADLQKMENTAAHRAREERFEEELAASSLLPKPDAPALTIFVTSGSGLVTQPVGGSSSAQCIHVFSERWRAVDYARTCLADRHDLSFAVLSAEGLVSMLRDLEKTGGFAFTIDCCPRCESFTPYDSTLADSADYLLEMIGVQKAGEMARRLLYYQYALREARLGHFPTARDVLLESVGHVTMSDPDTHLLLGQLGIAMEDNDLVREAHEYLRFFGSGAWDRKLDAVEYKGRADFQGPESSR